MELDYLFSNHEEPLTFEGGGIQSTQPTFISAPTTHDYTEYAESSAQDPGYFNKIELAYRDFSRARETMRKTLTIDFVRNLGACVIIGNLITGLYMKAITIFLICLVAFENEIIFSTFSLVMVNFIPQFRSNGIVKLMIATSLLHIFLYYTCNCFGMIISNIIFYIIISSLWLILILGSHPALINRINVPHSIMLGGGGQNQDPTHPIHSLDMLDLDLDSPIGYEE